MQYAIFIHLLVILGLKSFLAVIKWLNLSKKGHDPDDKATKSPQYLVLTNRHLMYEKENMMSPFFNLAFHLKIVMVVKNLFV